MREKTCYFIFTWWQVYKEIIIIIIALIANYKFEEDIYNTICNSVKLFLVSVIYKLAYLFPDKLYLKLSFRLRVGYPLNLDVPRHLMKKFNGLNYITGSLNLSLWLTSTILNSMWQILSVRNILYLPLGYTIVLKR